MEEAIRRLQRDIEKMEGLVARTGRKDLRTIYLGALQNARQALANLEAMARIVNPNREGTE